MKTILVLTDFSPQAENAALYAIGLAQGIKANVKLCYALKVPYETPIAGGEADWPYEDFDLLKNDVDTELEAMRQRLLNSLPANATFVPQVNYVSVAGPLSDVAKHQYQTNDTALVVMGMSGSGGFTRMVLGSSSRDMIEAADFPVLLIPADADYTPLNKIAFATELEKQHIPSIASVAHLAACFDAELLLANVTDTHFDSHEHLQKTETFLRGVASHRHYHKVYYRHIKSTDVDMGLDWLTDHAHIDMLVMVHKPHTLVERLLGGSHTQKLARHSRQPLLVFKPGVELAF
jgi:nucleotide-binding universal stress UspA family protein